MKINARFLILTVALATLFVFTPPVHGAEGYGQTLQEHIEALTDNGPRMTGTRAENLAGQYVEERFRHYGLEVETDTFVVENTYIYQGGHLSVKKSFLENLDFVPAIRSPDTEGMVSGKLVYLKDPSKNIPEVREEIVIIERGDFDEVREARLKALLVFEENSEAWTNVWSQNSLEYPVVTISSKNARKLIEALEEKEVIVELKIDAKINDQASQNVIGTLHGNTEETIIVSSHHDSVLTPGAIDGGTGTAVMLEIARELSKENLERTVKFVSLGAEEYGLLGSKRFAKRVENQEIVGVINIGPICSGRPKDLRIGPSSKSGKTPTPWLRGYFKREVRNLGLKAERGDLEGEYYSSHHRFLEEGIPATWILWVSGRENRTFWPSHTLADNITNVDENNLEKVTRLSVKSVRKLSGEDIEDWRWDYRFPDRFSIFTVLSSMTIVLGLAIGSYLKYGRGRKEKKIFSRIAPAVVVAIFFFYIVLISGVIQAF